MEERGADQDIGKLTLFIQHQNALIEHAAPIVGRTHAEDVVQEAYVRFSTIRQGGGPVEQPVAYLFRIVRNLALDWLRRMNADHRRNTDFRHAAGDENGAASPEDEALHRDELRLVTAALSALPQRTQRAFEMHRFDECTFQEIAERLDVSVTTAYRLVQDALVHLMRARQRQFGDSGTERSAARGAMASDD